MTTTRPRAARLVAIPAAVILGIGSLGCGIIDTVQNAVDTASTLAEFGDRLGKAGQLTYTAEYKIVGDTESSVTLVQQPPSSAIISGTDRLIFTADEMIVCDGKDCQRLSTATPAAATADAELVAGVVGPGFVTPEIALAVVAAAALVPTSDVETSERTIGGQESLCADVTGIEDPAAGTEGLLADFSVCVTETGLLASFSGVLDTGDKAAIELTSYSEKANAAAFKPPAGAKVKDVSQIVS